MQLQIKDRRSHMFRWSPTCTHRCELPKLFKSYQVGVEVGVLRGRYAYSLLSQWPGTLYLVDSWEEYPEYVDIPQNHEDNYQRTLDRLTPFAGRFQVWRERSSEDLASRIGMVDFAYVDANHAFEYVMQDLQTWWKVIKQGGILAGHDLFQVEHPGVTEALVLFAKEHNQTVYMVPGKDGCECSEGGVPSWYIRKGER